MDPPRPGVQYSVQVLRKSGVSICMITGDAMETAIAIATNIGIYTADRDNALSGAQLESMSEVCAFIYIYCVRMKVLRVICLCVLMSFICFVIIGGGIVGSRNWIKLLRQRLYSIAHLQDIS